MFLFEEIIKVSNVIYLLYKKKKTFKTGHNHETD